MNSEEELLRELTSHFPTEYARDLKEAIRMEVENYPDSPTIFLENAIQLAQTLLEIKIKAPDIIYKMPVDPANVISILEKYAAAAGNINLLHVQTALQNLCFKLIESLHIEIE